MSVNYFGNADVLFNFCGGRFRLLFLLLKPKRVLGLVIIVHGFPDKTIFLILLKLILIVNMVK